MTSRTITIGPTPELDAETVSIGIVRADRDSFTANREAMVVKSSIIVFVASMAISGEPAAGLSTIPTLILLIGGGTKRTGVVARTNNRSPGHWNEGQDGDSSLVALPLVLTFLTLPLCVSARPLKEFVLPGVAGWFTNAHYLWPLVF